MKAYSGLCIDGPRKGDFIKYDRPYLRAVDYSKYKGFSNGPVGNAYDTFNIIEYKHVAGLRLREDQFYECDFWTCENKTIRDILNELMRVFADNSRRERRTGAR